MDRKVLLGVGVAAAAAAALGGAAAAFMLLRDEDDNRKRHVSSRPASVEVRVRKEDAGLVIGRGGETVKEIQRRTNTRIHFKDERETDTHRQVLRTSYLLKCECIQSTKHVNDLSTIELQYHINFSKHILFFFD